MLFHGHKRKTITFLVYATGRSSRVSCCSIFRDTLSRFCDSSDVWDLFRVLKMSMVMDLRFVGAAEGINYGA